MVLDHKPRGYWRYIVAIVGFLIVLAIGAGVYRASIWVDGPNRYPEYRESPQEVQGRLPALSLAQASRAAKDRQPCENITGRDQSELCNQWRSAEATERASRWAWWQMVFSFFGIIGLGVTLWFNFEAWRQARNSEGETIRALQAAERTAEAAGEANRMALERDRHELRAYLGIDSASYDAVLGNITITVENSGKTPARKVSAIFRCISIQAPVQTKEEQFGLIDPHNGFSQIIDMSGDEKLRFEEFLRAGDDWICSFEIRFEDVFGQSWCRKANFSANINHLKNGAEWSLYLVDGSSTETQS